MVVKPFPKIQHDILANIWELWKVNINNTHIGLWHCGKLWQLLKTVTMVFTVKLIIVPQRLLCAYKDFMIHSGSSRRLESVGVVCASSRFGLTQEGMLAGKRARTWCWKIYCDKCKLIIKCLKLKLLHFAPLLSVWQCWHLLLVATVTPVVLTLVINDDLQLKK